VSSRSGVATLRTAIHLLLTYYLYEQYRPAKLLCPGCRQNSGEVSQLLYCYCYLYEYYHYCCCYTLVTYLLTFIELMTSVRPYTVCTCSGSLRVSLLLLVYFLLYIFACVVHPVGRRSSYVFDVSVCLCTYASMRVSGRNHYRPACSRLLV